MESIEPKYEVVKQSFLIHWQYVAGILGASLELKMNVSSDVADFSAAYENKA